MKILSDKKLPSGEYQLECVFTEEEIQFLINYAVNDILKRHIEQAPTDLDTGEEADHPHGAIQCPYCGCMSCGALDPFCDECGRAYFE
jgi:hypothetical protein